MIICSVCKEEFYPKKKRVCKEEFYQKKKKYVKRNFGHDLFFKSILQKNTVLKLLKKIPFYRDE
jgi:recombinational DNA repair protein RecT